MVRGWLPGSPDPAKVPAAPGGEVTVTGALQASETPGDNGVSAQGGLPAGQTAAISAAALVNLVPYDVYDAWVTLARADPGMTAVPAAAPAGTGLDLKAFQNLGYTGEWFVFAGFVVFMWFRLLRREVEFLRDAELGLEPKPEPKPDENQERVSVDSGLSGRPTKSREPSDKEPGTVRPRGRGPCDKDPRAVRQGSGDRRRRRRRSAQASGEAPGPIDQAGADTRGL